MTLSLSLCAEKYDLCSADTLRSAHCVNSVVYNDQRYATLDAGDPRGIDNNCQDYWLAVPPGWQLALPDTDSIAVAAVYPWGTHLLVYANGTQIHTAHSDVYSARGQTRQWLVAPEGLTPLGTNTIGFKVNSCSRRILLRGSQALCEPSLPRDEDTVLF